MKTFQKVLPLIAVLLAATLSACGADGNQGRAIIGDDEVGTVADTHTDSDPNAVVASEGDAQTGEMHQPVLSLNLVDLGLERFSSSISRIHNLGECEVALYGHVNGRMSNLLSQQGTVTQLWDGSDDFNDRITDISAQCGRIAVAIHSEEHVQEYLIIDFGRIDHYNNVISLQFVNEDANGIWSYGI